MLQGVEKKKRISFLSFSKGLVSSLMPAVIYFDSYLIEFCFMPTEKPLCCESQRNKERAQTKRRKPGELKEKRGARLKKMRLRRQRGEGANAAARGLGYGRGRRLVRVLAGEM